MTDKDLISKLNNLKNVNPDNSWLGSNRELFLAQISNSGGNELSTWTVFLINLKSISSAISKPVFALGMFMVVLVTSSVFSHKLFSQAKPNDSLYIARIISEKAKLNTVLDSNERNKMAVRFATDHAKDITNVLADPNFNTEENQDQVAKLNESFNQEINTVRTRMVSLAPKETEAKKEESVQPSEEAVSIATEYKDENGIQVSGDNQTTEGDKKTETNLSATATVKAEIKTESNGTTTSSTPNTETVKKDDSNKIIEAAKESFDKKEYNNVLDKLKEVNEIIK